MDLSYGQCYEQFALNYVDRSDLMAAPGYRARYLLRHHIEYLQFVSVIEEEQTFALTDVYHLQILSGSRSHSLYQLWLHLSPYEINRIVVLRP